MTIFNVYALHRVSKYMKQKLMKLQGEIGASTVITVDVNTPPSVMDRSRGRKSLRT